MMLSLALAKMSVFEFHEESVRQELDVLVPLSCTSLKPLLQVGLWCLWAFPDCCYRQELRLCTADIFPISAPHGFRHCPASSGEWQVLSLLILTGEVNMSSALKSSNIRVIFHKQHIL